MKIALMTSHQILMTSHQILMALHQILMTLHQILFTSPQILHFTSNSYESTPIIDQFNSFHYSFASTLTFVRMKSVSFSCSYSKSKSYLMSYDKDKETFFFSMTESDYQFYFPYVIQYFSKSYSETCYLLKFDKKTISKEQAIGIICGSVSVFFLIVFLIILFVRRNKFDMNSFSTSISSLSDSINDVVENAPKKNDKLVLHQNDDERDIDFWL